MKKASKKDVKRILTAIKKGRVVMGNEAVLHKSSPYIKVFDNRAMGYDSGFIMHWAEPGRGCGELTFVVKHGHLEIETEFMGLDFVKKQMMKLLDGAKITE